MPKAGFCKKCNRNVWLKEDGSCEKGHPPSDVKNVYEVQPPKKRKTWLIVLLIVSILSLLLLFSCAVAFVFVYLKGVGVKSVSIKPTKKWIKVQGTNFYRKADEGGRVYFKIPGKKWQFSINLKGFKIINDRGYWPTRMIYAGDYDTGILISIFAEKAARPGGAKVCRDYYWDLTRKGKFKYEDVKFWEEKDFACVEAIVRKVREREINQKNIHVYIVKDDVWFDIHMSKVMYTSSDRKKFEKIIDSIRFVEPDEV